MEAILREKDALDWSYRGEGAVNLVLAYIGSAAEFVGKVLRVQKSPVNGSSSIPNSLLFSPHECLLWKEVDAIVSSPTLEVAGQIYVQQVMTPLLGEEHVDAGMSILVSKEFLESIEKNALSQRPAWRVDAARVNTLCNSALLMADHAVFPHGIEDNRLCISVEVKPKCGFLPSSKFIASENGIKRIKSRFKMHQALKLHKQEIAQSSEYDPLDLFSGTKDRILRAMNALLTTPQNNFRVFLNGSLAYGCLDGGVDGTKSLTTESLEVALDGFILASHGCRTASFLQLVVETIFKSGVLDHLLEVQKLDNLDIEGAIHAYYNIISQPCAVCKSMDASYSLHEYNLLHQLPLNESLKIVRDYLIAATAKDCSLMISFRMRKDGYSISCNDAVLLESTGQSFDYKAYFIDLDMKPLKKMEYYYKLDQKIVNYFNQIAEE